MTKEELDLKLENETPEDESDLNETPQPEEDDSNPEGEVKEDLENPEEENPEDEAEELLSDGTPKKKKVVISYDKFKEINDESALYKAFSPLLGKLRDNPDLVDKLVEKKEGETLKQRVDRIEGELKDKRRGEMKRVITDAISLWPDFKANWSEIKPIAFELEKQGLSYEDAMQRAYFAVNPDAPREDTLIAKQVANKKGVFSGSGGSINPKISRSKSQIEWGAEDEEMRNALGLTIEQYAKHWRHVKDFTN